MFLWPLFSSSPGSSLPPGLSGLFGLCGEEQRECEAEKGGWDGVKPWKEFSRELG